jgi:hypothetical protein
LATVVSGHGVVMMGFAFQGIDSYRLMQVGR